MPKPIEESLAVPHPNEIHRPLFRGVHDRIVNATFYVLQDGRIVRDEYIRIYMIIGLKVAYKINVKSKYRTIEYIRKIDSYDQQVF